MSTPVPTILQSIDPETYKYWAFLSKYKMTDNLEQLIKKTNTGLIFGPCCVHSKRLEIGEQSVIADIVCNAEELRKFRKLAQMRFPLPLFNESYVIRCNLDTRHDFLVLEEAKEIDRLMGFGDPEFNVELTFSPFLHSLNEHHEQYLKDAHAIFSQSF